MEQIQHKFNSDPKLIGSPLCMICHRPKEAAIHMPKAQIIRNNDADNS